MVDGIPASDGAGVSLLRVIGTQQLDFLDPFLMLDEFKNEDPGAYVAGFPDHPHRGFETVSYMKAGKMKHHDSVGNEGVIEDGGVQWMTAGRGIIHSEMPQQTEGLLWGYQPGLTCRLKIKWTRRGIRINNAMESLNIKAMVFLFA